jgi:hypothetical protein
VACRPTLPFHNMPCTNWYHIISLHKMGIPKRGGKKKSCEEEGLSGALRERSGVLTTSGMCTSSRIKSRIPQPINHIGLRVGFVGGLNCGQPHGPHRLRRARCLNWSWWHTATLGFCVTQAGFSASSAPCNRQNGKKWRPSQVMFVVMERYVWFGNLLVAALRR